MGCDASVHPPIWPGIPRTQLMLLSLLSLVTLCLSLPSQSEQLSPAEVSVNVQSLRAALNHWVSADKQALIAILSTKSEKQMLQLSASYQASTGQSITSALEKKTSGAFEALCVGLSRPIAEFDAHAVKDAIYRWGYLFTFNIRGVNVLIDTLVGRSNDEVNTIKEAYKKEFDREMTDDIEKDLGGDLKKFFISILTAARDETDTIQDVDGDVELLYKDGQQRWIGRDSSTFFDVLNTRSNKHLRLVFDAYEQKYKLPIEQVIKRKFNFGLKRAFLAQVASIRDRIKYISEDFDSAVRGFGTDDNKLIRLVIRYRSPEMMSQIKKQYLADHGPGTDKKGYSLYDRIERETSGNFKSMILAIIGTD